MRAPAAQPSKSLSPGNHESVTSESMCDQQMLEAHSVVPETPRQRTLAECRAIIAFHRHSHGGAVTFAEVLGTSRARPVVVARAEIAKWLRNTKHWSYPVIGRFLRRDHTTVMNLVGESYRERKRRENEKLLKKRREGGGKTGEATNELSLSETNTKAGDKAHGHPTTNE
jgi:hypothetical protein